MFSIENSNLISLNILENNKLNTSKIIFSNINLKNKNNTKNIDNIVNKTCNHNLTINNNKINTNIFLNYRSICFMRDSNINYNFKLYPLQNHKNIINDENFVVYYNDKEYNFNLKNIFMSDDFIYDNNNNYDYDYNDFFSCKNIYTYIGNIDIDILFFSKTFNNFLMLENRLIHDMFNFKTFNEFKSTKIYEQLLEYKNKQPLLVMGTLCVPYLLYGKCSCYYNKIIYNVRNHIYLNINILSKKYISNVLENIQCSYIHCLYNECPYYHNETQLISRHFLNTEKYCTDFYHKYEANLHCKKKEIYGECMCNTQNIMLCKIKLKHILLCDKCRKDKMIIEEIILNMKNININIKYIIEKIINKYNSENNIDKNKDEDINEDIDKIFYTINKDIIDKEEKNISYQHFLNNQIALSKALIKYKYQFMA